MKYYKDNQNNVYAYEADGSQDHLIGDKVEMTAQEIEAHLNPPKTQEQLDAEAAQAHDDAMLQGFIYGTNSDGTDRYISVTKDDGDGLMQVKMGFDLDPSPTVIHFKNGTKLHMTIEEFTAFAHLFVTERKKFFV